MKSHPRQNPPGLTLLEMTLVICVLLILIGTSFIATAKVTEWRLGKEASEALRTVYTAQRMFLADNPTAVTSSITEAQIKPYLPTRGNLMPTLKPIKGAALTINLTTVPPHALQGGSRYDPSGNFTDNLWDVGE